MTQFFATGAAAAALLLCLPGAAMAQLGSGGGDLIVEADSLDVHNAEGLVIYVGRVDAVQDDTQIRTDRLELYFDKSAAPASQGGAAGLGDLDHAIAIGNVYYVTATQVATGDHAYYDAAADTVTLTGNVIVKQGCDVLTGSEVVMNLTTNDAQVRPTPAQGGAQGRVRTVIRTGGDTAPGAGCTL